jgi:pimeloyl-ACP methyl ester carboxylesterase
MQRPPKSPLPRQYAKPGNFQKTYLLGGPLALRTGLVQQTVQSAAALRLRDLTLFVGHVAEYLMLHDPDRRTQEALQVLKESVLRSRFRARPLLRRADLLNRLPSVTCPILAILGREDPFFSENLDLHVKKIEASNAAAHVAVVPFSSHWVCYDQPERTNDLICAFISTSRA